jgi:hypothetical protein
MEKKIVLIAVYKINNTLILNNIINLSKNNTSVDYFLLNYDNDLNSFLKKDTKNPNINIINTNISGFLSFLNSYNPNFILIEIPKLINILKEYINKTNKSFFLYTKQNIIITNSKCKVINNTKIVNFLTCVLKFSNDEIEQTHKFKQIIKCEEKNILKKEITTHEEKNIPKKNIRDTYNIRQKEKFRNICSKHLPEFRKIKLPIIHIGQDYEAVFIEFRRLEHTELLIRNCIVKLGEKWTYTIICGNNNYLFYKIMCEKINRNINIINIKCENMSQNEYNNFLLQEKFWNLLTGKKILIYQEDSFIFKYNIDDFTEWDFIGAPIISLKDIYSLNGGLSLRTRTKMIQTIRLKTNNDTDDQEIFNKVKQYIETNELEKIPEDVWFSYFMVKFKLGKVADFETAKKFSSEMISSSDVFGMHCFWFCNNNWENEINSNINNTIKMKEYIENDYFNKIQEYSHLINKKTTDIIDNKKEEFRDFCYKYTNYIRLLKLPIISTENEYEASLIEFRILPHLEFLIRNCIFKLGKKWSQTIVCGNLNYEYIKTIVKLIDRNIKIIKLNYDNVTQEEYSNLLLTKCFWENFIGEKILLYQEDSCMFKSNIDYFISWDYIGAPWPKEYKINLHSVGNGGFSLRSKSIMIKCIDHINEKIELCDTVKKYMKQNNLITPPEDVHFTLIMEKYSLGKIADYETALTFSSESLSNESFGGHQFWMNNLNWKDLIYKNIVKQVKPKYALDLEHRGGWKSIINYAINNNIYNNYSQIVFYDIVEKNFIWESDIDKQLKWFGIIHCTDKTPPYLNIININSLFNNYSPFMENIHNCLGLIVLAPNVYDFIYNKLVNLNIKVNIYLLKHPIDDEISIPKFNYDTFLSNTDKSIIQIGQQLRKVTSIYLLKTTYKKLWLTGTKNFKKIEQLFNYEVSYLNLKNIKINDVPFKYTETFKEYDELLSKNIIFIDLFDTAANNVVLECIIRATPLLIPKIPGSVFYLGENYPMYFNNLEEIPSLLTNENILNTHNYLKNVKVTNVKEFTEDIIDIIQQIN